MADIQYLNYGDLQIELLAFLTKAANEVLKYVQSLPWSNKRKEKFMSAYSDIMSKGITGVSNATGLWLVNVGGNIDLDSKDRKDREMYQEAAYFIQQQMAGLPTRASQEDEEKKKAEEEKSKLPLYNNFKDNFLGFINKTYFGNNPMRIGSGEEDDWNYLDERDSAGKRGTTNRANRLALYLEDYSKSLEEGKYNFEGSPYTDLTDLKSRINNAITYLKDGKIDLNDKDALNALGLKTSEYFNNGTGDLSGQFNSEGQELTYGQLAEYNAAQLKLKQQLALEQLKAVLKSAYNNTLFFTRGSSKLLGRSAIELKTKYKNDLGLINALNTYSQLNISSLTPDELSEIHGAYRFLAKNPIDEKTFNNLKNSSSGLYKNAAPNRFRKINGVDGFVWDSVAGQVIQILNRDLHNQFKNSTTGLFNGVKTQEELKNELAKAQLEYLANTNWTADLTRELAGIAADVVSVIDPEPITAGISALTGTGLRTYNRATDKDGFTLSDVGHTALDAGLSLLGMIPVVGDAALAARVVGKLQKAAGWLGTAFAAASVPLAAKAAWNKVVNGLDMTVDDWRAIGNVLMGATLARRIQLNRAAGNAVKNTKGGTKQEKVAEVEVKVNGKTEKVEIDEASAKELLSAYKKAGNDLTKTSEALRNSRAVREKLEAKKTSDGKPVYTKELLDAMEAPLAALGSIRGKASILARDRDLRGINISSRTIRTEGTPISENAPLRVLFAQNNKGFFRRSNYGWNINGKTENTQGNWLSRAWKHFKNPYELKPTETSSLKTSENIPKLEQQISSREIQLKKAIVNRYKETVLNNKFSKRNITEGEHSIGNENITIKKESDGTFSLTSTSGKYELRKKSLEEVKKTIANILKQQRKTLDSNGKIISKKSTKEIGKILLDLKKKGWLKQGGTIDKLKIQKYKEYIKK